MKVEPKICNGTVFTPRWRGSSCINKAITENGFCRFHDPFIIKAKRVKRQNEKENSNEKE